MADEQTDTEYLEKYGVPRTVRLIVEQAADCLVKAASAFGKQNTGDALNELYNAALNYGSAKLYCSSKTA